MGFRIRDLKNFVWMSNNIKDVGHTIIWAILGEACAFEKGKSKWIGYHESIKVFNFKQKWILMMWKGNSVQKASGHKQVLTEWIWYRSYGEKLKGNQRNSLQYKVRFPQCWYVYFEKPLSISRKSEKLHF